MSALTSKNYFVSDAGGNFKNAIARDGYQWFWCANHRLHLVVLYGIGDNDVKKIVVEEEGDVEIEAGQILEGGREIEVASDIGSLITRVRAVCRHIKRSSIFVERLKSFDVEEQNRGVNPTTTRLGRSVKTDMPVRWSSTEAMLSRAVLLQLPIQRLQITFPGDFPADLRLESVHFDLMKAVVQHLEPFTSAVELLSSSTKPTFSLAIFSHWIIHHHLDKKLAQLDSLRVSGVTMTVRYSCSPALLNLLHSSCAV